MHPYLYLTYFIDLAGGRRYYKFDRVKARQQQVLPEDQIRPEEAMTEVNRSEVEDDLEYLYAVADQWEVTISKRNHKSPLLIAAAKEANEEIKELKRISKGDKYAQGKIRFKKQKRAILLHMKYIYLAVNETLLNNPASDFTLSLWSKDIHATPSFMVHTMRRHFAPVARQFVPFNETTYHSPEINSRLFHLDLKEQFEIFNEITPKLNSFPRKIAYLKEDKNYLVVFDIKEEKKLSLKTFYPLKKYLNLGSNINCEKT